MTSPPMALPVAVVDLGVIAMLALVAIVLLVGLLKAPSTRQRRTTASGPSRRSSGAPTPFSYWYALVPYEQGDGAKERPVLVLRLDGAHAKVLKVTSQPKTGRTTWRRIDTSGWDRPGSRDGSWLETDRVLTIPLAGFRRCLGDEDDRYFRQELVRLHPSEFAHERE